MDSSPLLNAEAGVISDSFVSLNVSLKNRQMGGKEVMDDSYAPEVAQLVSKIEELGKTDVRQVRKFKGFKESAYRYVFAFEENYPGVRPHLQTILPSGQIENDRYLDPESGKGLIAYTRSQMMTDETAATRFREMNSPFVFLKDNKPYVMQTWPTRFNQAFKDSYTMVKYPDNPDTAHFEQEALDDFKQVALTLFEQPTDPNPPIWLCVKDTDNMKPMYEGTGSQLMALLRLRKDVREELDIVKILEPDGFECKYKTPKETGTKDFHMDLAMDYCLYTKQGWEEMACVKPKIQFDWESVRFEEESLPQDLDDDGVLSFPLEMELVSGPAYIWARRGTVVWVGALVMLVFSAFFYHRARWWEEGILTDWQQHLYNTTVGLVVIISVVLGLYCDDKAMSYCIVPWLQNVPRAMKIPFIGPVSHWKFRCFALACTSSQMLTIQLNAWVLGSAFANSSCSVEQAWVWLWTQSEFGRCPVGLIPCLATLWALSALQGIVPIVYGMAKMPDAEARIRAPDNPHHAMDLDKHSMKSWVSRMLPRTLREGVTLMALASGMRYTGSMSLSYPAAMIERIRDEQIGFKTKAVQDSKTRWQQTKHGWEYLCVKEVEKLHNVHIKRVCFILLFKYALQMNVQVTLFIIKGTDNHVEFNVFGAGGELLSLGAMMLGILSELYDTQMLCTTFWQVRESVLVCTGDKKGKDEKGLGFVDLCRRVFPCLGTNSNDEERNTKEGNNKEGNDKECNDKEGNDKEGLGVVELCRLFFFGTEGKNRKDDNAVYASHFFSKGGPNEEPKEEKLTMGDLRSEYRRIRRNTIALVLVAAFAMWLVGYEILKFCFFCYCPDGLWQLAHGCLPARNLTSFVNDKCNAD